MGKGQRNRNQRKGRHDRSGGRSTRRRRGAAPWVALGLFGLLGAGAWLSLGSSPSGKHPDPRPGITAEKVRPADRYAQYARVSAVYAQAAEIPAILDGLYCYCECAQHSGHRSLLTCYETDHAAACDVCMSEAAIAFKMYRNGQTLEAIREAVDGLYGT